MLSGKLVHLIEAHEEEIAARIIRSIRHTPELSCLGALPDLELRERGREILHNLGHWMTHENEEKLAREYESIGKLRFAEGIPLHESVRGLCVTKEKMFEFLDEQGIDPDSLALYAEAQLVRRMGAFFDVLIVHMARGYESAWRRAMQVAA